MLAGWPDRVWLALVALAFAMLAPIWFLLMADRFGWAFVLGGITLALIIRYHGSLR